MLNPVTSSPRPQSASTQSDPAATGLRPPKTRQSSATTGELAVIDRIRAAAAAATLRSSSTLRLGIGDDCAILRPPPRHEIVVTTDFSLEGRHFRRDTHPPLAIGHRTLARGLSDLAAMGAAPLAAFLSLAIPRSLARNTKLLDGFLDGLLALAARHNVPLAGGDTSESPSDHLLADIVLLGTVPQGKALRRSGARPGDHLYVTGALGGAAAELADVLAHPRRFRNLTPLDATGPTHPHLFPEPRLAVGQALLRRGIATACIDVSDGLSTDLHHLCQASTVAAELDIALLPAHPLTATLDDPAHMADQMAAQSAAQSAAQIAAILHGGEDYELLFTARPRARVPRSIAGVPITYIGRILAPPTSAAAPRMSILAEGTRFTLEPQGWEHLR
jgi:thiamine-monophosphate kinase